MSKQDAPTKDAPTAEPSHGQSVIERTVELMKTQGLGWSKAMAQAAAEAAETDDEIVDWPA